MFQDLRVDLAAAPTPYGMVKCNVEIVRLITTEQDKNALGFNWQGNSIYQPVN